MTMALATLERLVQYSTHGASLVASSVEQGLRGGAPGNSQTHYLQRRVAMSSAQVSSEGDQKTAEPAVVDMRL
jgi:hypothetical protein